MTAYESSSLLSVGDDADDVTGNVLAHSRGQTATIVAPGAGVVSGPVCSRRAARQDLLNTDLLESAEVGDLDWAIRSLERGACINAVCRARCISVAHIAAWLGHATLLHELGTRRANLGAADALGRTPLVLAAWAGHVECVHALLGHARSNADVNARAQPNKTPKEEQLDALNHGCTSITDCMKQVPGGLTALEAASSRAQADVVNALLHAGARSDTSDGLPTPADLCGSTTLYAEADKDNFEKTIQQFINYGKEHGGTSKLFNSMRASRRACGESTPLHAAVKLGSVHGIHMLLQAGAHAACVDSKGDTPVHVAVYTKAKEALKAFFELWSGNVTEIVDVESATGKSPLMLAAADAWRTGVLTLLEAGADESRTDKEGNTALHYAAETGDVDIVSELVRCSKRKKLDYRKLLDLPNAKGETPLSLAVRADKVCAVRALLIEGASADIRLRPASGGVGLHVASAEGRADILQELLIIDRELDDDKRLFDVADDVGFTPLHLAARGGHVQSVRLLLSQGAFIKRRTLTPQRSTALHLAASEGHAEVTRALLSTDASTLHELDADQWSAFHHAAASGRRECLRVFLANGADLSLSVRMPGHASTRTAVALMLHSMPRAKEFLCDLFDSQISVNEFSVDEEQCEVTVDYSILMPELLETESKENTKNNQQMQVVQALFSAGDKHEQKALLVHPYIESFLELRWSTIKPLFYVMLALYIMFVSCLTGLVLSLYWGVSQTPSETDPEMTTEAPPPSVTDSDTLYKFQLVLRVLLWIIMTCILFLETLMLRAQWLHALRAGRGMTQLGALALSCAVTLLPEHAPSLRYVSAFGILLSWLQLVILLSHFPACGYYYQMFSAVALRVAEVFCLFGGFMAVGFALTLWVLFGAVEPFSTPWDSLMKTVVMMTSEFDYGAMFEGEERLPVSRVVAQLAFLAFLLFVPIVLMNLLLALAVSDTEHLQMEGKAERLAQQVQFLAALEMCGRGRGGRSGCPRVLVLRPCQSSLLGPKVARAILACAEERRRARQQDKLLEGLNRKMDVILKKLEMMEEHFRYQ